MKGAVALKPKNWKPNVRQIAVIVATKRLSAVGVRYREML